MSANHCQKHPPTQRQLFALWCIREHQRARGYSASIRDVCAALGIASTNAGNDHVRALIRKGLVEKDELVARSLRVTPQGARFLLTFTPSSADRRTTFKHTGNAAQQSKADCRPDNNAARGEGA